MPDWSTRSISSSSSRQAASRSRRNCALLSSSAISQELPSLDLEVAVDQLDAQPRRLGLQALDAETAQTLQHDLALAHQILRQHRARQSREAVGPRIGEPSQRAIAQGDEEHEMARRKPAE